MFKLLKIIQHKVQVNRMKIKFTEEIILKINNIQMVKISLNVNKNKNKNLMI